MSDHATEVQHGERFGFGCQRSYGISSQDARFIRGDGIRTSAA